MKKRLIATGIVLVIMALVGVNVWQIHRAGDVLVETTTLSKETLTDTIIAQGKLKFATLQPYYFHADKGEVAEFFVKEGDTVKKGTKLFRYENKQLLLDQKANELQIESNYLELENLKKQHIKLDNELEKNKDDEQLKQEHDQVELQQQQANIETKQTQLQRDSIQQKIDDLTVKSNMDGTVVTINKEAALDSEQTQQPIIRIASLRKLIVAAEVSEYDTLKIKEGQSVKLTSDVLHDKSWKGKISYVSYLPKELNNLDTNDDISAQFPIEVVVEDKNIELKPGIQILVEIKTNKKKAQTLPLTAVKQEDNKNFAYVVNNGKVEQRVVKVGMVSGDKIEIKEGLNKKDNVIVNLPDNVNEGMEVTVK